MKSLALILVFSLPLIGVGCSEPSQKAEIPENPAPPPLTSDAALAPPPAQTN